MLAVQGVHANGTVPDTPDFCRISVWGKLALGTGGSRQSFVLRYTPETHDVPGNDN